MLDRIRVYNLIILRAQKILIIIWCILTLVLIKLLFKISFALTLGLFVAVLVYLKIQPYIRAKRRLWKLEKFLCELDKNVCFMTIEDLGLGPSEYREIKNKIRERGEAILAEIDQDGDFLLHYDVKIELPVVNKSNFLPRTKYNIKLVALKSGVAIRKDFCRRYVAFANELHSLLRLQGRCNVPNVVNIDFQGCVLYISYIPGRTVRQMLCDQGARMLDKNFVGGSSPSRSPQAVKWVKRIEEGRKYLERVLDRDTIRQIFEEVSKIHKLGVCLYDIKYGNIIIEKDSREPYFIDFENSICFKNASGWLFNKAKEYDLTLLKLHFE